MQEAAREATLYQRQMSRDLNAKARDALVKEGMQINEVSDEERQRMREKLQSVVAKYQNVVGEETAREFFAAIAKTPK